MKRHISFFFLTLAALLLSAACQSGAGTYARIEGFAQGGTYHVICRLPRGCRQQAVADSIDNILAGIDRSLSGYNKGSLLSRINAGEDLPLDGHFIVTFNRSVEVWNESDGAFDPSAAPLFDLWGFGFEEKDAGDADAAIDSIKAFVGMDLFSIEERDDGPHLVKADPRAKLNFNAIAQGYSCDTIARWLAARGCTDYLVEVGREIVCRGMSSRGGPWRVGLDKPIDGNMDEGKDLQEIIDVTGQGIVTSGNYRKFYIRDGQKYAHTIDPSTGRPVTHNLLSATVLAVDATAADAYATWFMVAGPEKAAAIAGSKPGIEAYLIYAQDDSMKVIHTDGIKLENNQQ